MSQNYIKIKFFAGITKFREKSQQKKAHEYSFIRNKIWFFISLITSYYYFFYQNEYILERI